MKFLNYVNGSGGREILSLASIQRMREAESMHGVAILLCLPDNSIYLTYEDKKERDEDFTKLLVFIREKDSHILRLDGVLK